MKSELIQRVKYNLDHHTDDLLICIACGIVFAALNLLARRRRFDDFARRSARRRSRREPDRRRTVHPLGCFGPGHPGTSAGRLRTNSGRLGGGRAFPKGLALDDSDAG